MSSPPSHRKKVLSAVQDALGTWDPEVEEENRRRREEAEKAALSALNATPKRIPTIPAEKSDDVIRPGRSILAPWGARHWRASVQVLHFDHGFAAQEVLDSGLLLEGYLFKGAKVHPKNDEARLHYVCDQLPLLTHPQLLKNVAQLRSNSWRVTVQFASDESLGKAIPISQIFPLGHTIPSNQQGSRASPAKQAHDPLGSSLRYDRREELNDDQPAMTVPWDYKQQRAIISIEYLHRDYIHAQQDQKHDVIVAEFTKGKDMINDALRRNLKAISRELQAVQATKEPTGRAAIEAEERLSMEDLEAQRTRHAHASHGRERKRIQLEVEEERRLRRELEDEERRQKEEETLSAVMSHVSGAESSCKAHQGLRFDRRAPFRPTSNQIPIVPAEKIAAPPTYYRPPLASGSYRVPEPKKVDDEYVAVKAKRSTPKRTTSSTPNSRALSRPRTPPPTSNRGFNSTFSPGPNVWNRSSNLDINSSAKDTRPATPRTRYREDRRLFPTSLGSYLRACRSESNQNEN